MDIWAKRAVAFSIFGICLIPSLGRPDIKAPEDVTASTASKNAPFASRLIELEESTGRDWALVQLEGSSTATRTNSHRKFGDFRGVNLRALRALGLNLRSFDFSNCDLRAADFSHSDLRGTNFRGADLREAVFISANQQSALYDARTLLPFSYEEAKARGWVEYRQ